MRLLKDFDTVQEKEEFQKMVLQAFNEAKDRGETNLTIYKLVLDELDFFSCIKNDKRGQLPEFGLTELS